MPEQSKLMQVSEPERIFDESERTVKKVNEVIRKTRTAKSPGPYSLKFIRTGED